MSRKSTKEARKNALSTTMSEEMWKQEQVKHAKGSDMTAVYGDSYREKMRNEYNEMTLAEAEEILEEFVSSSSVEDSALIKKYNNPLLEKYRSLLADERAKRGIK
ncbi:hypothetical protein [Halobacteriovorax sp. YZS-1-1]|uniref:hypothetical protein n=1 Tax=unclassified Halobacteriovorax TaxID=2639665 RepID=UPI003999AC04